MKTSKYHGIIPPLITPLNGRDTLDVPGLERLLEHLIAGGVHGLFLLGTTGEGPSLSYRLRKELVERTCKQVRGRVPVLVGITDTAFEESIQVAAWSARAGADALVVAPPYYLAAGQRALCGYLDRLAAELPLPLFLYNMPALTKVAMEPETVRHAMNHPGILGLKDSSCSMIYLHRVLALREHRPDWTFLVGPEEMLADSVFAGAHGGVNGGANLFPTLYVRLYEAARSGNLAMARSLHAQVMRLSDSLYRIGQDGSAIFQAIKCALSITGICDDFLAEPFQRFQAPERNRVRNALDELQTLFSLQLHTHSRSL